MARDCRGPKKNKGHDNPMETEKILKIVQEMLVKMQQQTSGFSVEEAITGRIVSKNNSDKCKVNDKVNKTHQLQNVYSLQLRVNNLNISRKKNIKYFNSQILNAADNDIFWISHTQFKTRYAISTNI